MASCTLEETLQLLNESAGTTFPASLFRSKSSGQLLYLEAGKDFVDALLSFLLLPVGTIIHMRTTGIQVKPVAVGLSSIFGVFLAWRTSLSLICKWPRNIFCDQDLQSSAASAGLVICQCCQPWNKQAYCRVPARDLVFLRVSLLIIMCVAMLVVNVQHLHRRKVHFVGAVIRDATFRTHTWFRRKM